MKQCWYTGIILKKEVGNTNDDGGEWERAIYKYILKIVIDIQSLYMSTIYPFDAYI